jgi:hypothetical protein
LGIAVLTVFIVYRTATFLRRGLGMRAILRQRLGKDEYEVSLRKCKALTTYFVITMGGIGLFLNVLLLWAD